jgi:hypothetical protein
MTTQTTVDSALDELAAAVEAARISADDAAAVDSLRDADGRARELRAELAQLDIAMSTARGARDSTAYFMAESRAHEARAELDAELEARQQLFAKNRKLLEGAANSAHSARIAELRALRQQKLQELEAAAKRVKALDDECSDLYGRAFQGFEPNPARHLERTLDRLADEWDAR